MLKSRGVIIKNPRKAKEIIQKTNYYNLINGYKDPFLQAGTATEKYLPGTTFEEIYALYEFDRKLRLLTLEYILEIEKQAKSLIASCFSKVHGHQNYLNIDNFDTKGHNKYDQTCRLLSNMYNKISSNIHQEPSVAHYVNGKNYIPLWVLVNTISMGDISKFYSNMLPTERADVARRLKWGVRENELESSLFFLSSIRNRCAHDERLFSYLSYVSLPKNNYFKYFRIISNTNNYFAVMVIFKKLLSKDRYISYQERLDKLQHELAVQLNTISIKKIRNMMGMPGNWNKLKNL